MKKPNLIFVFSDQWRAQAFGYAGDVNARTPNIDRFSENSVSFTNAVSGCPVCSPYRASLMTGQGPLTHGVFLNDVKPRISSPTFAEALSAGGYQTAYIGKWHADGGPRLEHTPPALRKGFDFWRALECTHDYNNSIYYMENGEKRRWEGYEPEAQTREAVDFIRGHAAGESPFALFLSWGPPHDPYDTAPSEFRAMFDENDMILRPNVPEEFRSEAKRDLAGYYSHCAALDRCFGAVLGAVDNAGVAENSIVVFTSDHGDMLCSQGRRNKQYPWDESVRVPFLIRWPESFGAGVRYEAIDAPDIMPTLLSLCDLPIPESVEGRDLSAYVLGGTGSLELQDAYLMHVYPYHQTFGSPDAEWRGIRTGRYTYVIKHEGTWLLYDNLKDPFQMRNLAGLPDCSAIRNELDSKLKSMMRERGDDFLPGIEYVRRFGHVLDEKGDVPYFHWNKDKVEFENKSRETL